MSVLKTSKVEQYVSLRDDRQAINGEIGSRVQFIVI